MKKGVLVVLLAALAGCASTAPGIAYRPASGGEAWTITAKSKNGVVSDSITILINNEPVASGTLHELKTKDTFTGTYRGAAVSAECLVKQLTAEHECMVFVGNERAAQLTF